MALVQAAMVGQRETAVAQGRGKAFCTLEGTWVRKAEMAPPGSPAKGVVVVVVQRADSSALVYRAQVRAAAAAAAAVAGEVPAKVALRAVRASPS